MTIPLSFEKQLKDPNCRLATELDSPSDCLLIAFGGLAGRLHIPPFEFFNATKNVDCKKLFVRDLQRCWYHRGERGSKKSISPLRDELEEIIRQSGAKRVVTVGTSSGGYAAILFGLLLGVDEIHAISPKTFINPIYRILTKDISSLARSLALLLSPQAERKYFDLAKVLKREQAPAQIHLHYGKNYARAVKHSHHISHDARVHLHPYDFDQHFLAKHLRDQGQLVPLLEVMIQGSEAKGA